MTALLALKAAVAAILALVLVRAFMGPAPAAMHPLLALAAGFVGVVGYPVAVVVAAAAHPASAMLLLAAAVTSMALAVWAARGPGDDGGEGIERDPEPPVDWEAFDRERARWERGPRVRA